MAIAVVIEFKGATLDQYDAVDEKIGLEHGAPAPPGCLFHWVTATEDGLRITDVWESKEQFESFAQGQIGPASAEVGVPGPPAITYNEVHNYLAGAQRAGV